MMWKYNAQTRLAWAIRRLGDLGWLRIKLDTLLSSCCLSSSLPVQGLLYYSDGWIPFQRACMQRLLSSPGQGIRTIGLGEKWLSKSVWQVNNDNESLSWSEWVLSLDFHVSSTTSPENGNSQLA